METRKLTNKKIWDEIWQNTQLPQVIKDSHHPYYVEILDSFFKKYLPRNENLKFLELGCAPGRWLHYFNTEFGYQVNGIDSSSIGLEITKRNLEILGIKANLYFEDIMDFKFNEKVDIVFSMGLIEHFNPPEMIIKKHFELTKSDGFVIVGIPNLKSPFYRFLQYLFNKELLNCHILLSPNDLSSFLKKNKLGKKVIYCGYVGVFNLYLLGISQQNSFLFRLIKFSQIIFDKILKTLSIKKETFLFSPYIFLIVKN